jgi:hypothetical protein
MLFAAAFVARRRGWSAHGRLILRVFEPHDAYRKTLMLAAVCALAFGASAPAALASPGNWRDLARSLGGPRDGDIVVDQQPNLYGGQGSDTLFYDYFGYEVWQREADNILLGQDRAIRRVVWWGLYGGQGQSHQPPVEDETMRIRFYGARPGDGLPDDNNIIYQENFVNAQRTATGRVVDAEGLPPEYRYEADLAAPVGLAAGSVWWIEVVQVGDVDSTFRWENAPGVLAGHAFVNDIVPDWRFVSSGSFAFQLSTIPEPCTAGIVMVFAVFYVARRRGGSAFGRLIFRVSEPHDA